MLRRFCRLICFKPEFIRERDKSKRLEEIAKKEREQNANCKKLLLLGAGESGKSTLFQQMIKLYGDGYSDGERQKFDHIVYAHIIAAMHTLIQNTESLKARQPHLHTQIETKNRPHAVAMMRLQVESVVTPEVGEHIKALWQDPGIRVTFSNRSKFQLTDNVDWFFDRIDAICAHDYCPTEQDILRSRVRTTGIVETSFEIERCKFAMFDVGGQRNERKKWIHCFEDVTSLIFVAALSEYDQVLYEDGTTNRLHEALDLFSEICNSKWFRKTPIILFLNKSDLFAEKLHNVNINVCFPQYFGEPLFEPCARYIQQAFESCNMNPNKLIYSHYTCATDSKNIDVVFTAVRDIIIRGSLSDIGLL